MLFASVSAHNYTTLQQFLVTVLLGNFITMFFGRPAKKPTKKAKTKLPSGSSKKPPTAGAAHVDDADADADADAMEEVEGEKEVEEAEGEGKSYNGAHGRAAREGMEPDKYYHHHSHLHPPESVLKQFDKHPLAVQVRQSHSV